MTTIFYTFGLLLVLLALAFLLFPLLRAKRSLLSAIILIIAVPVLTWLTYDTVGTPEAVNLGARQDQQSQADHQPGSAQSKNASIAALQNDLADNPDNINGWLLLARSQMTMNLPADAVNSYRKALSLSPEDGYTKLDLADAILRSTDPAKQQQFPTEAKQLLEQAYASNPELQKAQWLLGIAAASAGEHQHALDLWQNLLTKLEPGSTIATTVTDQINQSQMALGEHPAIPMPAPAEPTSISAGLNINLQLEEATSANPQAVVFVFLKVPGQVGMPLAVKRLTAAQLPINLQLTDADMLQPGKSLTDFPELSVSAKLSATGTANAHPDDLLAEAINIDTTDIKPVSLILK